MKLSHWPESQTVPMKDGCRVIGVCSGVYWQNTQCLVIAPDMKHLGRVLKEMDAPLGVDCMISDVFLMKSGSNPTAGRTEALQAVKRTIEDRIIYLPESPTDRGFNAGLKAAIAILEAAQLGKG